MKNSTDGKKELGCAGLFFAALFALVPLAGLYYLEAVALNFIWKEIMVVLLGAPAVGFGYWIILVFTINIAIAFIRYLLKKRKKTRTA